MKAVPRTAFFCSLCLHAHYGMTHANFKSATNHDY